jgi:hypothetical protein
MSELEILENIGTVAVLELRKKKLTSGQPFMINSDDLPSKQSYMEYPDGSINIVTISSNERSFTIIRKLSFEEAKQVRAINNLQ